MENTLFFSTNYDSALIDRIQEETKSVGYYNLPNQDTHYIDDYLEKLDQQQGLELLTDIVVIGIGGSSLGAKAIYHFLKPVRELQRKLHFIDSTDPIALNNLQKNVNFASKSTHFLIISKSGNTIETIAAYKYILGVINGSSVDYCPFTFITDKNSPLEKHAKEVGALVVNIQDNVGGRFSILSSVGTIPLILSGIRIDRVLQGANSIKNSFFDNGYIQDILLQKATFYAENVANYPINSVFSYTESLRYFNQWYVQLWGESLGKKQRNSAFNIGLTPVGLTGPKDQHSFLQLIMDGTRDKTITFIKLKNFDVSSPIPNITLKHLEDTDIINNVEFSTLINLQADSIIESLKKVQRIPLDEINIKQQDEFSIGQLIYYYELLTSLVGDLLNINTYDQPGVESGKQILMKKLKEIKDNQ
ncbi:MAG TPA: glucose-6-phosphate isomerase [Candidatus Thioglobus autotrophicus]|nr:glucose-6-phosphate isomerase [Candidatus Thioglobus autotrophicus]